MKAAITKAKVAKKQHSVLVTFIEADYRKLCKLAQADGLTVTALVRAYTLRALKKE